MTRTELFSELVKHADKLPWECSLMAELGKDGSELWFRKNPPMWRVLNADTADTDPDACVFIVWCLEFLKAEEKRLCEAVLSFDASDESRESLSAVTRLSCIRDVLRSPWSDLTLDATISAVVAVCEVME
jgi:hypothetical protein